MTENVTHSMQMAQADRATIPAPATPAVQQQPLAQAQGQTGEAGNTVQPEGPAEPAPAMQDGVVPAAPPSGPDVPAVQTGTEPVGLFQSMVDGIQSFIELGGPVVGLLLLLSVFALAIILLKLWQFYVGAGASRQAISQAISFWLAKDYEKAIAAIRGMKGPVARVVGYAMTNAAARRDEAHLREETEHLAMSELSSLRSYLRGLEAVVQVAPLLGLFGTVLGMIEAFRSLESAGAQVNPADLAGGIWVALLTTAVGLAIAMPVSLVLYWFESRIARVRSSMELFITEVMTNPPARAVKPVEGPRVRLATAAEGKNAN